MLLILMIYCPQKVEIYFRQSSIKNKTYIITKYVIYTPFVSEGLFLCTGALRKQHPKKKKKGKKLQVMRHFECKKKKGGEALIPPPPMSV